MRGRWGKARVASKGGDRHMDQPKTLTVPEAGMRYFDLGRNASYEAARRGDISNDQDWALVARADNCV